MTSSPLALVTGASSGIGAELARVFAENGFDVLMTAENVGLDAAAEELRPIGVTVLTERVDLSTQAGVEQLYAAVTALGRPVDAAALNAGIGHGGSVVESDLADELRVIDLNVRSTVHLAKLLLGDMVARRSGRLLVTSSIASTMPGPFNAVYNASKSFLQSFTEGVREEVKEFGVTVTSLMPGPTDTDFFRRADLLDTAVGQGPKDDPGQVAQQGFDALLAGKEKVVGGSWLTKAQALSGAVMPDALKAVAHRKVAEPGSTDQLPGHCDGRQ